MEDLQRGAEVIRGDVRQQLRRVDVLEPVLLRQALAVPLPLAGWGQGRATERKLRRVANQ